MEEIKLVNTEDETGIIEEKMQNKDCRKQKVWFYGEEKGQLVIFITLLSVVILLPLGRIVSNMVGLEYSMIVPSVMMFTFFGVSVLWILVEAINKRVYWKHYAIPYTCLIIMWFFSFFSSFDAALPKIAMFGNAYRAEGLFQIGGYYGIFMIATLLVNNKMRRIIIYVFLVVASVLSVLGIFQFLKICMLGTFYGGMASLGFGNPNFFAGFAVMFSGVAMGGYWLYDDKSEFFHPFSWWKRWVWLILVDISYIGCITSRSSVVYVGLIMMFLLLGFLTIVFKKGKILHIGIMLLLLLVTMIVMNIVSKGEVLGEFLSPFKEIEKDGTIFGDNVGTGRMGIWKNVIALLPMYWLYGCGIDNLAYVYLVVYGLDQNFKLVDTAHNEYLQTWITRGIIPLVLYLVFLFSLFIPGILQYKNKNCYETDDIKMMAIVPFFGYIAQAFFNISVTPTAPYFWIICGLLFMTRKANEHSVSAMIEGIEAKKEIQAYEIPEKNIEKI